MDSEKIGQLEEKIEQLDEKISRIENSLELLQSKLLSTHPSNNDFKIQFRKWIDKSRGDFIPNIDEFINDPPRQGDQWDEWDFWIWFKARYPIE
jgi:hypothetical protein